MAGVKNNTLKFSFNLQDYPLEAVYGAAYVFLDQAYLFFNSRSSKKIEVFLKGKRKLTKKQIESLKGEFLNELLNYTFRFKLAKSSRKIREYLVSQALISAVGSQEISEQDEFKYQKDPLGIAVPWEEKYSQKLKQLAEKEKIVKKR